MRLISRILLALLVAAFGLAWGEAEHAFEPVTYALAVLMGVATFAVTRD